MLYYKCKIKITRTWGKIIHRRPAPKSIIILFYMYRAPKDQPSLHLTLHVRTFNKILFTIVSKYKFNTRRILSAKHIHLCAELQTQRKARAHHPALHIRAKHLKYELANTESLRKQDFQVFIGTFPLGKIPEAINPF